MSVLFNHACRYELFDQNPISLVQELLRHSSLRSTLDIYTQAISPGKARCTSGCARTSVFCRSGLLSTRTSTGFTICMTDW